MQLSIYITHYLALMTGVHRSTLKPPELLIDSRGCSDNIKHV